MFVNQSIYQLNHIFVNNSYQFNDHYEAHLPFHFQHQIFNATKIEHPRLGSKKVKSPSPKLISELLVV